MTDPAFNLLLQHTYPGSRLLLIADENLRDAPLSSLPAGAAVLTNRFDIYRQGRADGLETIYSDYDFSPLEPGSLDQVIYRVSKEKPVVHHIINHAKGLLKKGGELLMAGSKNEGIKTYAKKIEPVYGNRAQVSKQGELYLVTARSDGGVAAQLLDDKNYATLRAEPSLQVAGGGVTFYSKPGLFGWNKIDPGSALLVSCLEGFLQRFEETPRSILDLGCGYGYLSIMAQRLLPDALFTATDNNAAAILACRKNFDYHAVGGEVIADDCAESISQKFDAVLCNPPFHQGFGNEHKLTDRFIRSAHRLLRTGGMALFVVNRFIPLERKSAAVFSSTALIAETKSFKVIVLRK